jgi:hypothetical protein
LALGPHFISIGKNAVMKKPRDRMAHLLEPDVKKLLAENLQECKNKKLVYYSRVMNLGLLFLFIAGLAAFLYWKRRTKVPTVLKKTKFEADRLYILNRIKTLQDSKYEQLNRLTAPY